MDKEQLLDSLANHSVWQGFPRGRLIPLVESGEMVRLAAGQCLFEQYHPAKMFYLLGSGCISHSGVTAKRDALIPFGPVSWPLAAVGWSGFLQPQRFGTTAIAEEDTVLLSWTQDQLSRLFYADPGLSVCVFRLILDSVCRQFFDLRDRRLADNSMTAPLPAQSDTAETVTPSIRAAECLQRSAFFGRFPDASLALLAQAAHLQHFSPGSRLVQQDQLINGPIVVAHGSCHLLFVQTGDEAQHFPFRRFSDSIGIVSGIPSIDGSFIAEASVYAETDCWVYHIPATAITTLITEDPEFGRGFLQRLLARLAGLIAAVRIVQHRSVSDPELEIIANLIANSQTQLPVTSPIHQIPYLLGNKLTVSTAISQLETLVRQGRHYERQIAAQAYELTARLADETRFYQQVLNTAEAVMQADESLEPESIRALCDQSLEQAFSYLDCRIYGEDQLPKTGGNIFILNHLACPAYYEFPNGYHFSFDTAFVGWLLWRHFGASAIRVVRSSPDAEFGHNLFYRRLGHITVPTLESGVDTDPREFANLRREAAENFLDTGAQALASGENLIICPEGQSQPLERSPARFHTGVFRLAHRARVAIVPVALAGFHQRFKNGPLVAKFVEPDDYFQTVDSETVDFRSYADRFRDSFAVQVNKAKLLAESP